MRLTDHCIALAATVVATSAIVAPAHAQLIKSGTGYYMTGDFTLQTKVVNEEIFVGKDTAFKTLPGTFTLTVAKGVEIISTNPGKGTVHNYVAHTGLYLYGNHRVTVPDGVVTYVTGYDTSTLDFGGGSIDRALGYNKCTLAVSGGSIFATYARDASDLNISGGTISFAHGLDASKTTISGGTFPKGYILKAPTATVNFVGKSLSFAHKGYDYNDHYRDYVDTFQVSGTFGGVTKTYDLHIKNEAGAGGKANGKARQFTLNGVAPGVRQSPVPQRGL